MKRFIRICAVSAALALTGTATASADTVFAELVTTIDCGTATATTIVDSGLTPVEFAVEAARAPDFGLAFLPARAAFVADRDARRHPAADRKPVAFAGQGWRPREVPLRL